jgi:hypothetical protein
MRTIICKECSDEVEEGEALNGYCDKCVDRFIKREESRKKKDRRPEDVEDLPPMGGFHDDSEKELPPIGGFHS